MPTHDHPLARQTPRHAPSGPSAPAWRSCIRTSDAHYIATSPTHCVLPELHAAGTSCLCLHALASPSDTAAVPALLHHQAHTDPARCGVFTDCSVSDRAAGEQTDGAQGSARLPRRSCIAALCSRRPSAQREKGSVLRCHLQHCMASNWLPPRQRQQPHRPVRLPLRTSFATAWGSCCRCALQLHTCLSFP